MPDTLQNLESAARDFELEADDYVDLKRLSAVVDRLHGKLCRLAHSAHELGDHLLVGQSACTWVANSCSITPTSAADRLCVGEQLKAMPRPHITVHTTIEALKGELGAPASELEPGMPVSSQTVQRLACDGMLSRVLKAGSVVVDVGRATPNLSPAQWRALKARHRTCAFPGCDRPINWTSPHHVEFRSRGGPTDLPNLLPLCHYHHRLVHEGGWQVVRAGEGLQFIPPDRVVARLARGPGRWWAAA